MSRALYDISPPVDARLAVWPGDTPSRRELLSELERGDSVTLSTWHTTVHVGAHADAPSHYAADAPSVEALPLEPYLGHCEVMRIAAKPHAVLEAADLPRLPSAPRLLLATGTFPDPTRFREDFAALGAALVHWLGARGVVLIGVDTPSVDPFPSKTLEAHRACLEHGIAILEGLALEKVPEGHYELIALPLRLVGFDASPVRAVLRPLAPAAR